MSTGLDTRIAGLEYRINTFKAELATKSLEELQVMCQEKGLHVGVSVLANRTALIMAKKNELHYHDILRQREV